MQVLILLRDPVERAFSAYNFTMGNYNDVLEMVGGEPWTATFMDIVKEGLAELDSTGINSDTGALFLCLICSYALLFLL